MPIKVLVFPCGSEIGLEISAALRYSKFVELFGVSSVADHGEFAYRRYREVNAHVDSPDFIDQLNTLIAEWGIDIVMPDLEFIEDRKKDLLGIVLTHGHEDHIGAIPYLAADLGVPLYANRFTAGLIAHKLAEEGLEKEVEIKVVDIDAQFQIGPFGIRLVPLAHSILEMSAAVIDTPYGRVFHTGDWKLDEEPILGAPATAAAATPRRMFSIIKDPSPGCRQ